MTVLWHLKFCFFLCSLLCSSLYADLFSQYAEARNILDAYCLQWPIKPFPISIAINGYVKNEGIIDSRQVFAFRDGQLLYFPLDEKIDPVGRDINGRGAFDIYAIETRLIFSGKGPCICGFESGFLIESDFFGRSEATINEFEQRFAYLELENETHTFLAGQFYHPICFPYESPNTISFNSGIPIAPYALVPQFKVIYRPRPHLEFLLAAIGYVGDRPFGVAQASDKIFRDGKMPDFFAYVRILQNEQNYAGIGFDIMRIVPRLSTLLNFKEAHKITATSADFFARWQYEDHVFYTKLVFAHNAATFEMIGGLAVSQFDPATDLRRHVPLRTLGWYGEWILQGDVEPGLFIGVAKNLGAGQLILPFLTELESPVFGIGTDIDTLFRISPRIRWYCQSFVLGIEYEYTRALYGRLDQEGAIINTHPVANNRFLIATYYIF